MFTLYIRAHSQLSSIKQSSPAVLRVSLTCPPFPVNSRSPEFRHHRQGVSKFVQVGVCLCCLLLSVLFVKARRPLSYRVLLVCTDKMSPLNDVFPFLSFQPSDEDTVSLNVPMSNIMEEDQSIKEDACHRLTPAKGLSEMCVESACFVGLATGLPAETISLLFVLYIL